MDLQVCAIIAIVFCVSLASLFFINQKLRGDKTFEDVLAEKRKMAYLLSGTKAGKAVRKKDRKHRDRRDAPPAETTTAAESEADSDHSDNSDGSASAGHSPAHHVEFGEAKEIVQPTKKNAKKLQQQARKNSKPILVNRSEPVVVDPQPAETLNHFEQIHPKDDAEIKKQRDRLQSKGKKNGSPKTEKPLDAFAVADVTPRDSPKHPAKDKAAKKKRNENANFVLQQQQQLLLLASHSGVESLEELNVQTVMQLLGRAELSRSEIQIIIDYLLNKQQDTLVDHSDWSDDPLQKLKKQLLEREQALADEQETQAGLQTKLRELRASLNTLSAENRQLAVEADRLRADRQSETQLLQSEHKTQRDRLDADNARLVELVAELQDELQTHRQQQTGQLQALSESNATLQQEHATLQQSVQQTLAEATQRSEAKIAELNAFVEQLKLAQTAHVKHLDDAHTVEIRNLQNALDSTNREANVCAMEANKWRQLHEQLKSATESDEQKLASGLGELRTQLAERDALLAQRHQQIAEQTAQLVQLQAQIGQQANASTVAAEQLSGNVHELKQRLGQEEDKVKELRTTIEAQTSSINALNEQQNERETRLAELQTQVSQYQEKNNLHRAQSAESDQVREQLLRLFPAVPAVGDTVAWIARIGQHVDAQTQQQRTELQAAVDKAAALASKVAQNAEHSQQNNNSAAAINNHHHNNHNNHVDAEIVPNKQKPSTSVASDALILENAELRATVEQYKKIVADAEGNLKYLEAKFASQ